MPATETEYEHITFENGLFDEEVPVIAGTVIAGTTMKVIELVRAKKRLQP